MSVWEQVVALSHVVCGGLIVAFIYDLIRIKRRIFKTKKTTLSIEDIVYWIFAAIVMFISIYGGNNGQIRLFGITGFFAGILAYFLFISRLIANIIEKILRKVLAVFKKVYKVIRRPLAFIFRFVSSRTAKLASKAGSGAVRGVKARIKKVRKMKKIEDEHLTESQAACELDTLP